MVRDTIDWSKPESNVRLTQAIIGMMVRKNYKIDTNDIAELFGASVDSVSKRITVAKAGAKLLEAAAIPLPKKRRTGSTSTGVTSTAAGRVTKPKASKIIKQKTKRSFNGDDDAQFVAS